MPAIKSRMVTIFQQRMNEVTDPSYGFRFPYQSGSLANNVSRARL